MKASDLRDDLDELIQRYGDCEVLAAIGMPEYGRVVDIEQEIYASRRVFMLLTEATRTATKGTEEE